MTRDDDNNNNNNNNNNNKHVPNSVVTNEGGKNQGGKVTVLWNQQVQTDRTIPNKQLYSMPVESGLQSALN